MFTEVHCIAYDYQIRKYGSTSYVGMGQVQNGVLYLRYRSDSVIMKTERCKAFTYKNTSLFYVESTTRLPLIFLKVEKIVRTNIHFALLSFFLSFPSCITQNYRACMKVLDMQRMLYYQKSSFSGLELQASYDWQATAPNHHGLFPIHGSQYIHFKVPLAAWHSKETCSSMTARIPHVQLYTWQL